MSVPKLSVDLSRSTTHSPDQKPIVILNRCETYDVSLIQKLCYQALVDLRLKPFGKTLIKPNVVASGEHFPHAYTRPEMIKGLAQALKQRSLDQIDPQIDPIDPINQTLVSKAMYQPVEEWAIGERCGITMPTRFAFEGAGYDRLAKEIDFKLYHFEEEAQVEIPLTHPERLRDSIYTPKPISQADFFVNCPKFKAHPWTTVTFSMKNYIGIQDDHHRLIDHDHRLNEKIADLQFIIQPQFIAIDAIIAGEGRMLTPIPFDLGLIAFGNQQLAFDAVCCHIIGVDPLSVDHLRYAYERGFGEVDLNKIEIRGDLTLAQAQAKAKGFRVGLIPVDEYFQGSKIKAYGGKPPQDAEDESQFALDRGDQIKRKEENYCWGGCPGALEEAIEILRIYDQQTDEKLPATHIVFGAYEGKIDAKEDEKVFFMGDCASYQGEIHGKPVQIESRYQARKQKNPKQAKAEDIFVKILKMTLSAHNPINHIKGCPVSVAEQVLLLVKLGKLKNPYLDPKQSLPFVSCYFSTKTRKLIAKLLGQPQAIHLSAYDQTERGLSRPYQSLSMQEKAETKND